MNDAGLHDGLWPDVSITSGNPLRPSHTTKNTSLMPLLFMSVSTLIQNFDPSPPRLAGPQPQDVAGAVHGDAERDIDRPIRRRCPL